MTVKAPAWGRQTCPLSSWVELVPREESGLPLPTQGPPGSSLLPDSWRPWADSGDPGQGPGKERDTEARRSVTLSAAEGTRGPLQPGRLPAVTTPRHPHSYPQDPEPLRGGGLEPWGAGMHGLLLHAHPAPGRPAGLWRNQGLALALRPARGRPRWGMYAPAPGPGPSLGEASGAKAPPGRAEPPCSPQPGPRQEAGAGGAAGSLWLLVPTWLLGRRRWWPGRDRGPSGTLCVPAVSSRSSSGEGAPRISSLGGGQGAAERGSGVGLPRALRCVWSSLRPFEQSCLRITRGSSL